MAVLFANLGKAFGPQAGGESNQRGPKPAMNECELPLDEPADENFLRFSDGPEDREDVRPCGCAHQLPWMGPPMIASVSFGAGPVADTRTMPRSRTKANAASPVANLLMRSDIRHER